MLGPEEAVLVLFFKSFRLKQQVLFFGGEVIEDSNSVKNTISRETDILWEIARFYM